MQAKALETLRAKPIESASEATKALLLAQREEERILGAVQPRAELTVERGVRERYERRTLTLNAGANATPAGDLRETGEPSKPTTDSNTPSTYSRNLFGTNT